MGRLILAFAASFLVCSCGSAGKCSGLVCGACAPPVMIDIVTPAGEHPTVTGAIPLDCTSDGNETHCQSGFDVAPGTYTFDITAPGDVPARATLQLEPGKTDACCACPVVGDSARVVLLAEASSRSEGPD